MNLHEIRTLYTYNEWAHDRMSGILDTLDPEQLARPVESSFGSLLATFAHVVASEWVWLERWTGNSPGSFPEWKEQSEYKELRIRLAEINRARSAYLEQLAEEDLDSALRYRNMKGESFNNRLGDLFIHVVNHSTYHRGQLTTQLRQVGATPVSTDYIVFIRERVA